MSVVFQNRQYGSCFLSSLRDKQALLQVLQDAEALRYTSIGDLFDHTASEKRVEQLFESSVANQQKYGLGFYEIYTANRELLGICGFLCEEGKSGLCPEICCYILPQSQNKKVGSDVVDSLIDLAFRTTHCYKIIVDIFPENERSTAIFRKRGFVERTHQYSNSAENPVQTRYKFKISGVYSVSELFRSQKSRLRPLENSLTLDNLERVRELWFALKMEQTPVLLCQGGVKDSFIKMSQLAEIPNLQSFSMYRSDRIISTVIPLESVHHFFLEEKIFSTDQNFEQTYATICLGAHEGCMRIARCIYEAGKNDGIFYPTNGYGLLALGFTSMTPIGYTMQLMPVNEGDGEKIVVEDLMELTSKHPTTKTLYLDLKTTAGAVYSVAEVTAIIDLCKKAELFLIADIAHVNMQFESEDIFPDVFDLCVKNDYHHFAVVYTSSKVYGLERGRTGFILLSNQKNFPAFHLRLERDMYRVLGSAPDLPFELAKALIASPLESREQYRKKAVQQHYFNMNMMVAYLEGVESQSIDPSLKERIAEEVDPRYSGGIQGMRLVYRPKSGIHMKVDMSELREKYFLNFRMVNAEIFSYLLCKVAGVAALHSYHVLDPSGMTVRLCFSIKEDVHRGMRRLHTFVRSLSEVPQENRFLPGQLAEDIIFA